MSVSTSVTRIGVTRFGVTRFGVTRIVLSRLAMTRITQIITVSAVLAVVAACTAQPDPVDPPAPPSVPFSSAPTPSPSATLTQEDKDRAEAEQAYRRANSLVDKALMADGTKALPDALSAVADPQGPWYLIQQDVVEKYNKDGLRFDRETIAQEVAVARRVSAERIILFVCEDGRAVKILDRNGQSTGKTRMVAGYLTVRRSADHGWRVFGFDKRGLVEVNECSDGKLSPSQVPS